VLTDDQVDTFRRTGHLTVANIFDDAEIDAAITDLDAWSREFLGSMRSEQRDWYLEGESDQPLLRKLDNPVYHREVFRSMARHRRLVAIVHQLIGDGLSVFFSQVFMKPPEVGGPKPIHQDNFYFGPNDLDATLTAWIALDEATIDNGCLHYSNVHQSEIFPHVAPEGEPFNLQIPAEHARRFEMSPEPVPRGGVSFHHGNTPHQSSANRSPRPRRAAAFHYLLDSARLADSGLSYDASLSVPIG
jgi:ectoine hydroxylase-related dioxygenase (phytanoyl-CoA dioxygenase family)